jgi:methyl-accepting chemotaxis protein
MLVSSGCHREGLTMKLTNTSLLTRLLTGFGAILALSCLLGVISLQKLETVSGLTEYLYEHSLTVSTSVLEANAGIIAMHRSMKDVALAQDAAGVDSAAQAVDASEKQVFAAMAVAQERFLGDKKQFGNCPGMPLQESR